MGAGFDTEKVHYTVESKRVLNLLSRAQTICDPMDYSPPGPLSMEFSRQEYYSGLPSPSPGDLPDPGIKPQSPELQGDSLLSEPLGKPN